MFKNILVLSPHTDDGELGCGGTISKLLESVESVEYIAFSAGGEEVLKREMTNAMRVLGVDKFRILDFEKRHYYRDRQEILDFLYKFAQENSVDLVLTPSTTDLHQDHQVVTNEAIRAFKNSTILGYEMPWNNVLFRSNCFVALEEKHVRKKLEALRCYKTQIERGRNYFEEDFLRGILRTRGTHIKTKYAEAFEVIKLVI